MRIAIPQLLASKKGGGAALTANAGPDATLTYATATAMAGSASGGTAPYTYAWSIVDRPQNTLVTFGNATSATSTAKLEGVNGDFTLKLTVTDALNATASDTVVCTLKATRSDILGSLYLWNVKASSLSNGAVTSWPSVATDTTALAQATAGKKPTKAATSFNGKPGVSGTLSAGSFLSCTLGTPIASGKKARAYVIGKLDAVPGADLLTLLQVKGTGASQLTLEANNTTYQNWRFTTGNVASGTSSTVIGNYDENPHIWTLSFDGVAAAGIDGSRCNLTSRVPDESVANVALFADVAQTRSVDATIAEVLITSDQVDVYQDRALRALFATDHSLPESMPNTARLFNLNDKDVAFNAEPHFQCASDDGVSRVFFWPGWDVTLAAMYDSKNGNQWEIASSWDEFDMAAVNTALSLPTTAGTGYGGALRTPLRTYLCYSGAYLVLFDHTASNWKSTAAYTKVNLGSLLGDTSAQFYGNGVYDGSRYAYLACIGNDASVRHLQIDTLGNPQSASSYKIFATERISAGGLAATNCAMDQNGRVFFCPSRDNNTTTMSGMLLVWDPAAGSFNGVSDSNAGWSKFDFATLHAQAIGYSYVQSDGGHKMYYSPGEYVNTAGNGYWLIEQDTRKAITDVTAYKKQDITQLTYPSTTGYQGMAFDGRKFYFTEEPYFNQAGAIAFDATQAIDSVTVPDTHLIFSSAYELLDKRNYTDEGGSETIHKTFGALKFGSYIYIPPFHSHMMIRIKVPTYDALVVNAGSNQTVYASFGFAGTLAGSATGGMAGRSFAWSVVSAPGGGSVIFTDSTSPTSSYTLSNVAGSYVLRLTCTDNTGASAHADMTATLDTTTKLLDVISTPATFAAAMEKVRGAYAGAIWNINNGTSNGDVSTEADMQSFCGASNGVVNTWKDQSGNANDVTATTTARPKVYDGASGHAVKVGTNIASLFDGSANILARADALGLTGNPALTIAVLWQEIAVPADHAFLVIGGSGGGHFSANYALDASHAEMWFGAAAADIQWNSGDSRTLNYRVILRDAASTAGSTVVRENGVALTQSTTFSPGSSPNFSNSAFNIGGGLGSVLGAADFDNAKILAVFVWVGTKLAGADLAALEQQLEYWRTR